MDYKLDKYELAREQWARYEYVKDRGHTKYCVLAKRNDDMYLGAGGQWPEDAKRELDLQGRPYYEFNDIFVSINSAIGYQIANRMDITYKPRGGKSDSKLAEIHSKIAMYIADQNDLQSVETEVFKDGIVQQRGYFDVRMCYEKDIQGEIKITNLDPMDVIPDPDSKTYDPDGWNDVIVLRWLTLDEIENLYGKDKRKEVEEFEVPSLDFGTSEIDVPRNSFGDKLNNSYDTCHEDKTGVRRYRVIDRQRFINEMSSVAVYDANDLVIVDNLSKEKLKEIKDSGVPIIKRVMKRVKWTVTTSRCVLFDDYSPYDSFTVVPFFCIFSRGKTVGLVDNAIGPQEALNKAISQYIHIVNSSANSGYMVPENTLKNMTTNDLENIGATTGLVIEYDAKIGPPTKIQPNQIPSGMAEIIKLSLEALKNVTVPDTSRGMNSPETSGVAIQSKQFASQQQLAVPLSNLSRTRTILAKRILNLVQRFYTGERIIRITETDPVTGKSFDNFIEINKFDEEQNYIRNDLTIGDYDVVVSTQPLQVTFDNSQFTQAMELRNAGIGIPDKYVLGHSNISNKYEIIQEIENAQQSQPDPEVEANVELIKAKTDKVKAETVDTSIKSVYSAMQSAQIIESTPETSTLADSLLKSSGFVDKDMQPIVPNVNGMMPSNLADNINQPVNTTPNQPAIPESPAVGYQKGIITPENDGVLK